MKAVFRCTFACLLLGAIFTSQGAATGQSTGAVEAFYTLTAINASQGEEAAWEYFNSLDRGQQGELVGIMQRVVVTDESSEASPRASGCWDRTFTRTGYSAITGDVFWRLSQSVYWCGNGTFVTYLQCSAISSTPGFGWTGGISNYCATYAGGTGYNVFRKFTQANFSACFGAWGCPITANPVVYQQGEGNGAYSGWAV